MGKTLDDFYNDLGARESGGNYKAVNTKGFIGKYQMGEAAMVDAGYYKPKTIVHYDKNIWDGQFTGKDGVYSVEDFLNSPKAQENAQRIYKKCQWGYIKNFAQNYDGKTINGVLITQSGMLAATHLLGQTRLQEYLTSNGKIVRKDGYGTSIEEYLKKFAGYDVSEITGLKNTAAETSQSPQTTNKPAIISNQTETNTYDFDTPYKLQIEKNDYVHSFANIPFADPVNRQTSSPATQHIFTPEEIGKMSTEEFAQNEALIMEQIHNGQIKNQVPSFDYSSFKNPESGKSRVFTREDLDKMTTDEFSKNENEIRVQMNSIGIPYEKDLPQNVKTFSKEKSYSTNPEDGKWVTINGNHVFIEK